MVNLTSLQAVQGGGETSGPHPPHSSPQGKNESPADKCSFNCLFLVAATSGKVGWWERKKRLRGVRASCITDFRQNWAREGC